MIFKYIFRTLKKIWRIDFFLVSYRKVVYMYERTLTVRIQSYKINVRTYEKKIRTTLYEYEFEKI